MKNDHSWRNAEVWGPERPLGVWLLTAIATLFAGVLPIGAAVALLVTGASEPLVSAAGELLGVTPLSVLWTLAFGAATIVAAVAAWRGRRNGWIALLVLIAIHYWPMAFDNALILISGEVPPEGQSRMMGRVIRYALYPVMYLWYYRRPGTQEFIDDSGPAGGG